LRVVDLVGEGFDCAIRLTMNPRLPAADLIAKRIGSLDIGFYASVSYAARRPLPKHPRELVDHDNVALFLGDTMPLQARGPRGVVKVRVTPRTSGDDLLFVRAAVVAGVGIGALPWFIAKHDLEAGTITRALPEYSVGAGAAYVAHPPAKPLSPKVSAFASYLVEHGPRMFTQP